MKKEIYILAFCLTIFASCNPLGGLYKHEICGKTPDCFLIEVCRDGKFTYWYSQDILGTATLTGNWSRKNDTVLFRADPYLFDVRSKLNCQQNNDSDSIRIQVILLRKYFQEKRDTTYCEWMLKLNNEQRKYFTNDKGFLNIPYQNIEKITVRDPLKDLGINLFTTLEDSVFQIPDKTNDIKIYLADNKSGPIILWSDMKMKIKNRKLIRVLPDSLKNCQSFQFIRIKRECGNIKNK